MIKILAVGNSFSQDATALIDFLTDELYVRNLFYPGCSLEQHYNFFMQEEKAYEYQHNGAKCKAEKVSLKEALLAEKWDYITIQQASGFSGITDSYYPYIKELIAYIKKFSNAEIVFHQTWSYESNAFDHPDFIRYDQNKDKMWNCIAKTSEEVCERERLRMIKCGAAIYALGQNDFFNLDKGGISLYRDSYHLTVNYGRLITACLWVKFFTGKLPEYILRKDLPFAYKLIRVYLMGQ